MSKFLPLYAVICVGLCRLVVYHDESMLFFMVKGKLEPYLIHDEQIFNMQMLIAASDATMVFQYRNLFSSLELCCSILFPCINMVYKFIYMYASKLFSLNWNFTEANFAKLHLD